MSQETLLYIARILAFATAIPLHEMSHGLVSYKLGDPTAKNAGRLTMNPIKHIDFVGLLAMLIIGIGWAKPVPIDPRYYKNRKRGMALSALAGPVSNLLLAYACVVMYKLVLYFFFLANPQAAYMPEWLGAVYIVLIYSSIINVNLAIFNLIPIPPFDGSKVFGVVLPEKLYFGMQRFERYIMGGVLLAMFVLPRVFNVDPLGAFFGTVGGAVSTALDWATGYIDILFGLF